MPITQVYTSLLDAIEIALGDPLGPLPGSGQIDVIEEDLLDEVAPSETLARMIARNKPVVLLADGGSEYDMEKPGGGNEFTEKVIVHVYYGIETPSTRKSQAGDDDGTPYYGEFQMRKFILDKLTMHNFEVDGWTHGLLPVQRTPIPVRVKGKVARKLTFAAELIHQVTA